MRKYDSWTTKPASPARGDIDWTVLAPLLVHVVVMHVVVGVVRVTLSYRTVELGLPVIWPGIIAAGFAILPVFFAVQIGRYIDRGHDAHAAWIGSAHGAGGLRRRCGPGRIPAHCSSASRSCSAWATCS